MVRFMVKGVDKVIVMDRFMVIIMVMGRVFVRVVDGFAMKISILYTGTMMARTQSWKESQSWSGSWAWTVTRSRPWTRSWSISWERSNSWSESWAGSWSFLR